MIFALAVGMGWSKREILEDVYPDEAVLYLKRLTGTDRPSGRVDGELDRGGVALLKAKISGLRGSGIAVK